MSKLIIVDSDSHKEYEDKYREYDKDCEVVYTTYEDDLIRKVRNYRFIGGLLYHILMWKKSIDYATYYAKSDSSDILCINPLVGLFLGLFNKKYKKIILAGFLFEPKKNKVYYYLRKKLVNLSLKGIQIVVVYSRGEVEYYQNLFPAFKDRFKFVHYGLTYPDEEKYAERLPERFVFSGGGSNRDYETLVRAYENSYQDKELLIATQPWRVPQSDSQKIKVLSNVVVETFGDVMSQSDYLVLSLKDVELSAGHMVMLQAMSSKVPIVVNDIPSVRDYVDETMVTFYKSGDIESLTVLLDQFDVKAEEVKDKVKKSKQIYDEEYTSLDLMRRLLEL